MIGGLSATAPGVLPDPIVRGRRPARAGDQRTVWIEDHTPDCDLRHDGVTVRLITYTDDYYGMSQHDVEMARQISAAGRQLGLSADPSSVQSVLVIPGALYRRGDAVLARRARIEPRRDSPAEGPRGSARSGARVLVRADRYAARGRRRRHPRRHMGAVRAGGGSHRGCARRRRPHGRATSSHRRGGRWRTRPETRSTSRPLGPRLTAHGGLRAL